MIAKKIKVGSRESLLAVKQAEIVMAAIQKSHPYWEIELITFKTTGDKILHQSLDTIGGKGLFIKELENALQDGTIDIAVHSYKDVPYEETEGLPIVALSPRESPFDVLVLPKGEKNIDPLKPVGTSSKRRSLQFTQAYTGLLTAPIRGNVLTRIKKLDDGLFSALVLAEAGLVRLGLQDRISKVFTPHEMIPSSSQGILAIQGKKGIDYSYLRAFHSKESEIVSRGERQFLQTINGGCTSPAAAYAAIQGQQIRITGFYENGYGKTVRASLTGSCQDAKQLGERLARMLQEEVV